MSSLHPLVEGVAGACHTGDVGTLQAMLTQYPELDINLSTEGGVTLLMHAIIGAGTGANPLGHYLEVCQLLVQAGVYLETADLTYGRTASHWATYYHREDILAELIIAGCDMTCPDFSGTSPLHLAIEENATTCLTTILRFLPKEILEIPDSKLRVPLVHAVQVNNLEICQILLQGGANVNCIDQTTGRTPLHFAAEAANSAMIEFLIRSGGILDTADASGLTPIHIASIVDSPDALNAIVKVVGSEVLNLSDVRGLTPLMHACLYGNEGNVRLLLKKKVDILSRDAEGKSCLHWAVESLHPSAPNCVQLLCKKQKELIDAQDNLQRTPLHVCAIAGNVESMRVLLSLECNVTCVDNEQHTAIHWAAVSGNPDVLILLLDAGCPLDIPDIHGAFPLHYAAQEAKEPPQDELYTEEAALQSQNVLECLRILIERGAPVDCRDGGGMQPLHWALQFPYNTSACSLLLSHGADPNAKDSEGMTGLHISARHGLVENCQFLLEHTGGIHGNEVDSVGQTALFHAVEGGHAECVEYLLSSGLSPDHRNSEDRTPSHVAATVGALHCLQILQAYGANFQMKSVHGAMPMHEAAANGHADVLEYLISCGCQVNEAAGSSGSTALHYSVSGGHEGCVRVLVQYGAEINPLMTSEEGEQLTPLDYCTDNAEIVDLLRSHGALTGVELSGPAVTAETVEESAPVTREEPSQADKSESTRLESGRDDGEQGKVVDKVLQEEARETGTEGVAPLEPDRVSMREFRPPSPSKQSLNSSVFESEKSMDSAPAHVVSPRRPSRRSVKSTEMKLLEGVSSKPLPHLREMKRRDAQMEIAVGMRGREMCLYTCDTRQQGLLERALSVLKRGKSTPPSGSILSSAVGFYASHATMLAAAVIGTPLGEKTLEVAEKVATDTAEELKKAEAATVGELPDLVWLQEGEKERTPTPVVAMESPPSPSPSPPPIPDIQEDPYERRMRKAKAQMDMTKTPAFRAVEELVRAQNTHMKLRREFEEAKLSEDIAEMKEAFQIEEHMAQHTSERVMRRFRDRMQTAEAESEQVSEEIDRQLRQARDENAKLSDLMVELGVSPRPTVAQWLQQKREQKKAVMQDALISWDRNKQHRDAAILLQQTITSQRALKHAVWGARKEISAKIKVLKDTSPHVKESSELHFPSKAKSSRLLQRAPHFPKPPPSYRRGPHPHRKTPPRAVSGLPKLPLQGRATPHEKNTPKAKLFTPTPSSSSVRATPHGFLKIRDEDVRPPARKRAPDVDSSAVDEEMWKMGESYAQGKFIQRRPPTKSFLRATGPKSVHAERTLHFIPPGDYEAMKAARKTVARENWRQELGFVAVRSPRSGGRKSSLVVRSLDFEVKDASSGAQTQTERRRRSSFGGTTVQYHSLADSLGEKGKLPWKQGRVRKQQSVDVPVLPMNVLDSSHLPEAVMS